MKIKKSIALLCTLAMTVFMFAGCNGATQAPLSPTPTTTPGNSSPTPIVTPTPSPTPGVPEEGGRDIELPSVALKDIAYELTLTEQNVDEKINVFVPSEAVTGDEVRATVAMTEPMKEYYYYVVDWGDGTWSYDGPYQEGQNGTVTHVYKTAGEYSVRGLCQSLTQNVKYINVGWSAPVTVSVIGDSIASEYIKNVRAISSDEAGEEFSAENICDNDNTTSWKSCNISLKDADTAWVGYEFDTYYRLDTLEIKIPSYSESFPEDFAIEYTTDRGANWYSLPKYYYMYSYRVGRGEYYKIFKNPKGATLIFDLDGIVANGIRICSKRVSSSSTYLDVAEMRVTGDKDQLFYSSLGGIFDADLNNMFTIYGTAETEQKNIWSDPFRSGQLYMGSAEWINWNGIKLRWTADDYIRSVYESTFAGIRTGEDTWSDAEDGFVWATAVGQKHLDHQSHYTQNSLFIIEARNYLLMQNNAQSFLESQNGVGQTISDRIDASIHYLLTTLQGESGILTINDPENLAEAGYEGGSQSSNYWDRYSAFGYKSSYENVFFYQAVLAMIDIENVRGNTDKADEYTALAEKIKTEFNKLFWDSQKGRYITSVNKEGKRLDFGITFTNFMACAAGLASREQAEAIYSWIDGERIAEGDTSQGEDIYYFKYSARSNTLDVSKVDDNGYYWVNWNGDMYCYEKDGAKHGAYGNQMQNGGTIFYTSYYDLMGRFRCMGADNAYDRLKAILTEFHLQDQLRVFPYPTDIGYSAGVIGEFPESGMVPVVFLEGFLGIVPSKEGLSITPQLTTDMTYAGVREYRFNDNVYNIKADKNISEPKIEQNGDTWIVEVPANGTWILNADNEVTEKK